MKSLGNAERWLVKSRSSASPHFRGEEIGTSRGGEMEIMQVEWNFQNDTTKGPSDSCCKIRHLR